MSGLKIQKPIDLTAIFQRLKNQSYCIIKLPASFPDYDIGSDLDVFCYDIQSVSTNILGSLQEFITQDIEINVENNKDQIYIDIIEKNAIHFRFDMYGTLPYYKNVGIKKAFFSSVIENSKTINIQGVDIKVPCDIDEAIIRYIEYQEWYADRPDKIKHILYLEENIKSNNLNVEKLFEKLHYYTLVPNIRDKKKLTLFAKVRDMRENFNKVISSVKNSGFRYTIVEIIRRVVR